MAIAAAVLLVVVLVWRRRPTLPFGRRVILVGLGTGTYQALYFAAVVAAGVTVATVVSLALAPLLLTAAEAVHERRLPSPRQGGGLTLAIIGLLLVSTAAAQTESGPHPWAGVGLAIASGTAYAAATAAGQSLTRTTHPLAFTTSVTMVGALALAPLGVAPVVADLVRGGSVPWSWDPVVLALLCFLGVATMALAYGLFYAGLRVTRGSVATVASLLEPVTAALAAVVLLGEPLAVRGVVGTLLILAAILGLALGGPVAGPVIAPVTASGPGRADRFQGHAVDPA
jgi:DME family drug/metabolite transporter